MRSPVWLRRLGAAATLALAASLVGAAGSEAAELVVYSSRHYPNEAAFEAFQKKTGTTLKILHASDAQLFERLKSEGDKTPADVLITVDAGNLWKAGQAGLLAAAYVATKVTQPLRIGATLALTPLIAHFIRKHRRSPAGPGQGSEGGNREQG